MPHPETQASYFSKIILLFKQAIDALFNKTDLTSPGKYQHVLDYLGINNFRSHQKEIIDLVMDQNNVLVVMPTGAGKSLCYWVPGLMIIDHTLVISPLKSLMYDQTQKLMSSRINATYINSSLRSDEKYKRLDMVKKGLFRFITVAP